MLCGLLAGTYLLICAETDLKTRRISLRLSVLTAVLGCALHVRSGNAAPELLAASLFPGVFCLTAAFLTGGKIGYGDGIAMVTVGLCIGGTAAASVLLTALILSSAAGVAYCLARKRSWQTELPFLPFLALAYLISLCLEYL